MKNQISLVAFIIMSVFVFLAGCDNSVQSNKKADKEQPIKIEKTTEDCSKVTWSNTKGENGPENWKNLCVGFAECGGKSQSPVDISTKDVEKTNKTSSIIFDYSQTKANIINNSHTIQFNVDNGNKIKVNEKDYQLLQFHYHALSEHTIDGKHFPLEVHYVHKHSDTDFIVLGVMFVEGKENQLFKKYLKHFPNTKGEYKSENTINILDLFPNDKSTYNYKGSLTTPPCSEVVSWYVFKKPVEASKKQIEEFSKILDNNYRPIQPLNNRKIEETI